MRERMDKGNDAPFSLLFPLPSLLEDRGQNAVLC